MYVILYKHIKDFVEQNVELFLQQNESRQEENRTTSRETGEESNEEEQKAEKQEEMKQQQVVAFLSQTSVNSELGKLGRTSQNETTVTLDEAMTSIEPTLLDEEWISHFLAGNAEPQSETRVGQQQSIGNDAMLSTLNSNNSVVSNDIGVASSSNFFDRDSAAAILATNGSLFGPSNASIDFASLLNNTGELNYEHFHS